MKILDDEILSSKKDIEKKLDLIHKDIKIIIEESNKNYLEELSTSIKNEYLDKTKKYLKEENFEVLEEKMVYDCDCKENCEKVFNQYLEKSLNEFNPANISQNTLNKYKKELNKLKENSKYEKCDICFNEVSKRFLKQANLINSLNLYKTDKNDIPLEIDVKYMVNEVLDPIANKQRLEIIKSISLEPKTFSELSKITNLRGGNLLFHIEKLQDNDLIFQKNERGMYILTKKGFKIIDLLKNFQNNQ